MEKELRRIFSRIKKGKMSIREGLERLKSFPFLKLKTATLDTYRSLRRGIGEVILGEGKRREEIMAIVRAMLKAGEDIIITRLKEAWGKELETKFGGRYFPQARIFYLGKGIKREPLKGKNSPILIVTGGTSDIPVAEEAAVFLELLGHRVKKIYDIGVAGIHRTFHYLRDIKKGKVIIVVAGMEGALASVISGLVDKPVIAVPTSVGYGANFRGLSALLTMLNACSPGIAVVNIDNGFGAAYFAHLIITAK